MEKYIEIVNIETKEIEDRMNVSDLSDEKVSKIERGININIDHGRFYTRTIEKGTNV